jgi:D-serine deaminase-like pyridoxal phosphate-dependent protein
MDGKAGDSTPRDLGPNTKLIGALKSRSKLITPALVLDLDSLEFNLRTMSRQCSKAQMAYRPHAKTHKSIDIARMQIQSGAIGISVATLREASIMVKAGLPGVLLTSPIAGKTKIEAFIDLIDQGADLMGVVDCLEHVKALEAGLIRRRKVAKILLDVDLGMGRTGVRDLDKAAALVRRIRSSKALKWEGIQAYSGRVQHIARLADRRRVYGRQLKHLKRLLARLAAENLMPGIVSGGGTGTLTIDLEEKVFTEVQCGSYVFMDVEYDSVELQSGGTNPYRNALYVQCAVVSNNVGGSVTIDGGTKSFSTDGPAPQLKPGLLPSAVYDYFGDEFGRICLPRKKPSLKVGRKIELIVPHCDPTVNLHNYYHCVRGAKLLSIWPVDARGSL